MRFLAVLLLCVLACACKTRQPESNRPINCHLLTKVYSVRINSITPYCDSFQRRNIVVKYLPDSTYYVQAGKRNSSNWVEFISRFKTFTDSSITFFYPDGTLRFTGLPFSDTGRFRFGICNERHGFFTWYDSLGHKEIEEGYRYNYRDGKYAEYNSNGTTATEGAYKRDLPVGLWKYYDSLGKISREEHFKNGFLDGEYKEYHPNGKLKTWGWYSYDRKYKTWRYYDQKGKLIKSEKFKVNYEPVPELPYDFVEFAEIMPQLTPYTRGGKHVADSVLSARIQSFVEKHFGYSMDASDYKEKITNIFLKVTPEEQIYLVYTDKNNQLGVIDNVDWYFKGYPAVICGEKGVTYFEVDYTLYSRYE